MVFGFSSAITMCYRSLITTFDLLSAYYDVMFFVVLLRCFICVSVIQTDKTDSIDRKFQIMIVSILNNWNRRYSNHYIIEFINFISIYVINLDIVSSIIIFSNLYLETINILQV